MDRLSPSDAPPRWPDFERTGPDTLAGRYLRSFWQPVYVSSALKPGRARPLKIMNETFTLFRSEAGTAHVLADRCLHRGTMLSTGRVEGDTVRCLYHGWRYDPQGRCVERPAEGTTPPGMRVRSYPTKEWAGLVFTYFGPGDPPSFPRLSALSGSGALAVQAPLRPFNYFRQLENGLDEVHFNFVHRDSQFTEVGLNKVLPSLQCEESDYGLRRVSIRAGVERVSHFLMPNAGLTLLFGALHLVWRVPVDDRSHISFTLDYLDASRAQMDAFLSARKSQEHAIATAAPAADVAAAVVRGELEMDDVVGHPDLLSVQDMVALLGQGDVVDREVETLGASDNHIVRVRRLWASDMAALAEGQPIRSWRWPESLTLTSGIGEEVSS